MIVNNLVCLSNTVADGSPDPPPIRLIILAVRRVLEESVQSSVVKVAGRVGKLNYHTSSRLIATVSHLARGAKIVNVHCG